MIINAECFEFRPEDRDYNKKGKPRNPKMEVLGGGISYALRTQHVYGLLIWDDQKVKATDKPIVAGNLHKYGFAQADNVYSVDGVSPVILAHLQGQIGHQVNILEEWDDGEIQRPDNRTH